MTILARRPLPDRSGCMKAEIVLRHLPHNAVTPYVTHQHNVENGDNDGFYWGHYHKDLAAAAVEFEARCAEQGALK